MTERMRIRALRESEVDALILLEEACGLRASRSERYARMLAESGAIFLGAFDDEDDLLGAITGRVVADEFQIENVAVQPTFRRRGIGAQLVLAGIDRAREAGAQQAFLEVRASNLAARMLYERAGFCQTGVRGNYYADPREDAMLLTLNFLSRTNL